MKTLAYLLLISMCLAKSFADLELGHSFFSPLDEDQKVKLYWNISTANKEIYFTVEAQTTGWIGFGISSGQGRMEGADIVIGWVKDGKPYFKDRHADGHVTPQIDSQQDYELISLVESGGKTTMKFKRKFETCDPEDNAVQEFRIPRKEVTVLPGDSLTTVCKYRTGGNQISGGIGTDEEMCLSFLVYYPKLNLTRCMSSYGPAWDKFDKTYLKVPDPPDEWTDKLISELRKSYQDTDDIYAYCSIANSKPLPGFGKKLLSRPVINTPLKKEPECQEITNSCDKLASCSLMFVAAVFMLLFSCIY